MELMSVGASSLAHDVHYAVLAVGLVGVLGLLLPQWAGDQGAHGPRDEHERRVAELHRQLTTGRLGTSAPTSAVPVPGLPDLARTLLPIAIVSSAAAAGVHAAVAPDHFHELTLFGIFFTVSAVAQLLWSISMALEPTRRLLLLGVVGNAGVLGLWAVTRTTGLPFGLLPKPEEVGAWDLCCGAWELVVVVAGAQLLRDRPALLRLPRPGTWSRSAQVFMTLSALALTALTVSGAGR